MIKFNSTIIYDDGGGGGGGDRIRWCDTLLTRESSECACNSNTVFVPICDHIKNHHRYLSEAH